MSDEMIEIEKAAEWFENRAKTTPMPGARRMFELAAESLREKANGVTAQEWISVKDRLPDKDGCYIVTACDEGCSCGDGIWYDTVVIEAEHYKGEWSWNENGTEYDITDFVTHWMPLPEPPNETKHKHATQKASEEA